MSDSESPLKPLRHTCEAMNTEFTIFFDANETDPAQASSAAQQAFQMLEKLEAVLSRYISSSDIARVNELTKGETYSLFPESLSCLNVAAAMADATNRAFDPSAGAMIDFWKKRSQGAAGAEKTPEWAAAWERHRAGEFALDPESRIVQCVTEGSLLDLGAIGKGFALDEMAQFIQTEWELSRVLLSAGGSTVLALDAPLDKPGWKISFSGDSRLPCLYLVQQALSSSGNDTQPTHLVDPRTGLLVSRTDLVRSIANSAAESDALSTAFFVMSREEAEDYCVTAKNQCALFVPAIRAEGVPDKFEVLGDSTALQWDE